MIVIVLEFVAGRCVYSRLFSYIPIVTLTVNFNFFGKCFIFNDAIINWILPTLWHGGFVDANYNLVT